MRNGRRKDWVLDFGVNGGLGRSIWRRRGGRNDADCELEPGHGGLGQSEFLLLLNVSKHSRSVHDWDPST